MELSLPPLHVMQVDVDLDPLTLKRAQQGDPKAQAAFLRAFAGSLRRLVRLAGRHEEGEDQLQELSIKLLQVVPQFDPRGPARLSTWVFTVAHRWLLGERRRRRLQAVAIEEAAEVPDEAPALDEALFRQQQRMALEKAVLRLPEAQRRVFVLTHFHQQPLAAVAEVEGVPVGTIKSRLHRARAELVLALAEVLDTPKEASHASTR
jgi:RNA polymerase sigma-70 factor (ECF subfamily)